jgi:lipoprotein-anchoring transpeptidase ErfK/SrfK
LVIHTSERFVYLVQGNNRALRYGIGVGREGFQWAGLVRVSRKAEWPDWRPPPEMIARQPYLPRFMSGGPGNRMGARAHYLGSTVFRIHGTNQPETIGHAISSGCFRLATATSSISTLACRSAPRLWSAMAPACERRASPGMEPEIAIVCGDQESC